jgi:nucleotide-binding universal stress UspA family protein
MSMRTILCPVDFSAATPQQVDAAAALCRVFGARLVLHHNVSALPTGLGVRWMWAAERPPLPEQPAPDKLNALRDRVPGIPTEMLMTNGPDLPSVLAAGEQVGADLVVLSTHGASTLDHASVTERILERGNRAILVLHDSEGAGSFALTSAQRPVVVVPADRRPEALPAIAFAAELARALPLELHLLQLLPSGRHAHAAADLERARLDLRDLVPTDLEARVTTDIERREGADGIVEAALRLRAACIVMGEHVQASRGVLHKAPCPVWYVPKSAEVQVPVFSRNFVPELRPRA